MTRTNKDDHAGSDRAVSMLARVARMRAAVDHVRHGDAPEWSRLALDLGYDDQSHRVHDLKELTGLTPGQRATLR